MFLPNKSERYTASLRNFIHNSTLKNGITKNKLLILKKILIAESKIHYNPIPTNIDFLSQKILLKTQFFRLKNNEKFSFKTNLKGNFIICQKTFSYLLLAVCNNSQKIETTQCLSTDE